MNTDDPVSHAISEWQRKHRIADDDPVLAVLELMRLQLQHVQASRPVDNAAPPTFEDFRSTIELLDRRSKGVRSARNGVVRELRQFGPFVGRLNCARVFSLIVAVLLGVIVGALAARAVS